MAQRTDKEIKAEFRARQGRQITAIWAALFTVVAITVLYRRLGGFSKPLLFGLQAIAISAFLGYSAYNWRCPSCGKYLGGDLYRERCRKCGVQLR